MWWMSAVMALGSTQYEPSYVSYSVGEAVFTITSAKAFEIEHRCSVSQANGWGLAVGFGDIETYTTVKVWKQ